MTFELLAVTKFAESKNFYGSGGIRTHAPEKTGALNQRLRPLGHATLLFIYQNWIETLVEVINTVITGISWKLPSITGTFKYLKF